MGLVWSWHLSPQAPGLTLHLGFDLSYFLLCLELSAFPLPAPPVTLPHVSSAGGGPLLPVCRAGPQRLGLGPPKRGNHPDGDAHSACLASRSQGVTGWPATGRS